MKGLFENHEYDENGKDVNTTGSDDACWVPWYITNDSAIYEEIIDWYEHNPDPYLRIITEEENAAAEENAEAEANAAAEEADKAESGSDLQEKQNELEQEQQQEDKQLPSEAEDSNSEVEEPVMTMMDD